MRAALRADNPAALRRARTGVQDAKVALGERGPVWWTDGAPDWNRHLARNTPYAAWWAERTSTAPPSGAKAQVDEASRSDTDRGGADRGGADL